MVSGSKNKSKGSSKAKNKKPVELASNTAQLYIGLIVFCAFIFKVLRDLVLQWSKVAIMGKIGLFAAGILLLLVLAGVGVYVFAKVKGKTSNPKEQANPIPSINPEQSPAEETVVTKTAEEVQETAGTPPSAKTQNFFQRLLGGSLVIKRKIEFIFANAVFMGILVKLLDSSRIFYMSSEPDQKKIILFVIIFMAMLLVLSVVGMIILLYSKRSVSLDVPKEKKEKQKLSFAKNKWEALVAVLVVLLALGKVGQGIYTNYIRVAKENQENDQAQLIAQSQQENLMAFSDGQGKTVEIETESIGAEQPQINEPQSDITISVKSRELAPTAVSNEKVARSEIERNVVIPIESANRVNPFLPYNVGGGSGLDVMSPPTTLPEDSEAKKVMGTVVSGILYDKYNPSAILNIEGSDYLVKRGDVINGYHVLNIMRDQVSVQLGKNVYRAGVGEILASGEVNYNNVYNLNKKFGGNTAADVTINVKRR